MRRGPEGVEAVVFGEVGHLCGAVFASAFLERGNDGVYCACSLHAFFFLET